MFGDLGVDNKNEINSFEYYFSVRESRKILFLINSVVRDLSIFNKDEVLRKIDNSGSNLNEIKEFFYKNYNIFPDYKGPKVEGQWGNKSFLNTIKFFSVLDATKNSTDIQWKTDVFLKHLGDWIDDLHDNINYFSELDDYDQISSFLRSGENNEVEFKSTFGLPLQGYENQSALKGIRADIIDKVAKTILAMANSSGGKIFIGIIEKAGKVNSDLKTNIVERDGISFLDINFSLKEEKEDFDNKRLALQQVLKNLTKERMDFLDSLFSFRFYKIYIESKKSHIEILTIHIKKANKNIFIEKDNWITLPKRLNGRVELVNPADELQKE